MARLGGSLANAPALVRARGKARRARLEPNAAIRIQIVLFATAWALIAYGISRLI